MADGRLRLINTGCPTLTPCHVPTHIAGPVCSNTITARGVTSTPDKADKAAGEDSKRKRVAERLFVDENKSTFFRRYTPLPLFFGEGRGGA